MSKLTAAAFSRTSRRGGPRKSNAFVYASCTAREFAEIALFSHRSNRIIDYSTQARADDATRAMQSAPRNLSTSPSGSRMSVRLRLGPAHRR